jgi:glycosyltransferase involved in cell wall biosynthesis
VNKPKILLDLRPLQGQSRKRGIGTYVRGLLEGLEASRDSFEFLGLVDSNLPRVENLPSWVKQVVVHRRFRGRFSVIEDAVRITHELNEIGPNVYHSTEFSLPGRTNCKVVATIHDLIPWVWKGPGYRGQRVLRHWQFSRLKYIDFGICVSTATKNDVTQLSIVSGDKLAVVYNGLNRSFRSALLTQQHQNLPSKYLLYVGGFDERKNLLHLFLAFKELRKCYQDLELYLAGDPGPDQRRVRRWLERAGPSIEPKFLGQVGEKELVELYSNAICLAFPSLYEGFGLVLVEAMACGCPVVAYKNSAIPEVAGDSALLANNNDLEEFTESIGKLISDNELRNQLITRGKQRAANFTWEKCAKETCKIYQMLL